MSRKGKTPKRDVLPDPIYNSKLITKLINTIMMDGKRGTAQKILYDALEIVGKETGQPSIDVLNKALDNIFPVMELKVKRIGGANYQIPVEVTERRKKVLGLRWLVQYARLRNEKSMELKLAKELIDASNGIGGSVKKRDETHKMAEANKAFAHYRW